MRLGLMVSRVAPLRTSVLAGLRSVRWRSTSVRHESKSAPPPAWEVARTLLEEGNVEDAHNIIVENIAQALERQKRDEGKNVSGSARWELPLLLLELSKSFLKQTESQDAMKALEHAVLMFEDLLNEPPADLAALTDEVTLRRRYVESQLHLGKLSYLSGQLPECEHLWKSAISQCVKHFGRDSDEILVASNGLSEFYLEQLRLSDAARFTAASIELARELLARTPPPEPSMERRLRERLTEALSMAGLGRVQTQDWDGGEKYYRQALAEIELLEKVEGAMDNFIKPAYFNIYRNLEHMYRGRGDEAKAEEVVSTRMAKLGVMEDVTLEEQQELQAHLSQDAETVDNGSTKAHQ